MTEPARASQPLLQPAIALIEGGPTSDSSSCKHDEQASSKLVEMWSRLRSVFLPETKPTDPETHAVFQRMHSNFDGRVVALTKEGSALQEAIASCAILERQVGLLAQCPVALLGRDRAQAAKELHEECRGKRFVFEDRLTDVTGERRLFERAIVGLGRPRVSSLVLEALVHFERDTANPRGTPQELEASVATPIREMTERFKGLVREVAEGASAALRQV